MPRFRGRSRPQSTRPPRDRAKARFRMWFHGVPRLPTLVRFPELTFRQSQPVHPRRCSNPGEVNEQRRDVRVEGQIERVGIAFAAEGFPRVLCKEYPHSRRQRRKPVGTTRGRCPSDGLVTPIVSSKCRISPAANTRLVFRSKTSVRIFAKATESRALAPPSTSRRFLERTFPRLRRVA